MKTLFLLLFVVASGVLQAQNDFQIQPHIVKKTFTSDTATVMRFACVYLKVDLNSQNHRPVFLLELANKDGVTLDSRNVNYEDMVNACTKNGIPETEQNATIQQVYCAVFCGTKAQKIASIGGMMAAYGITLISSQ